tara:strand:- start:287 stop:451 length:165 start_codon:yes stop_codon:yes gene_type:complete
LSFVSGQGPTNNGQTVQLESTTLNQETLNEPTPSHIQGKDLILFPNENRYRIKT